MSKSSSQAIKDSSTFFVAEIAQAHVSLPFACGRRASSDAPRHNICDCSDFDRRTHHVHSSTICSSRQNPSSLTNHGCLWRDNRIKSPCRPSGRRRKGSAGANLSRICATLGHEFIVSAALDDAAVIEHDDVELARSPKVGTCPARVPRLWRSHWSAFAGRTARTVRSIGRGEHLPAGG